MSKLPPTRDIIVIGASAGGVEALSELLRSMPADLRAAIFIVMHIPPHLPSQLDRVLAKRTALRVKVADDREAIEMGTVYVASADQHLMLDDNCVRLTRGPKECRSRPAVDVLFRSAAVAYGPRVIGVVLSGSLDDGTAGLWAIKDHAGLAFVQDPSEAVFESMPLNALQHVPVDFTGPVVDIGLRLREAVGTALPGGNMRSDNEGGQGSAQHAVEVKIAAEDNGLEAGVMKLGMTSKYTCPDCHGVLVQIEEGSILRFRCHTGHAYSAQSLAVETDSEIDKGLWNTIRVIEERILLLRQMADRAQAEGNTELGNRYSEHAQMAEKKIEPLRQLVLDGSFFQQLEG